MPRIGTRKSAKFIADWTAAHGHEDEPEGWEILGSGGTRTAWLNKAENVVYKTCHYEYGEMYDNEGEIINYRRLSRRKTIPPQVRIPLVSAFNIMGTLIIAMERAQGVIGNEREAPMESRQALFSLGFRDMHGLNFFVLDSGQVMPIDLASPLVTGDDPYEGPDQRVLKDMRRNIY